MRSQNEPRPHEPRDEPSPCALRHTSIRQASLFGQGTGSLLQVPDWVKVLTCDVLHRLHNHIEVCRRGTRAPGIYDHHPTLVGVDAADYYRVGATAHADTDRTIKREIHNIDEDHDRTMPSQHVLDIASSDRHRGSVHVKAKLVEIGVKILPALVWVWNAGVAGIEASCKFTDRVTAFRL